MAAVWGQMSTGGGHSALEETMSIMEVPVIMRSSFIDTERVIGEMWKQELLQSMAEAGREERQLAIEHGEYHEGVPAIIVVVDGGWSKRSHKHSYNANSGVGIILGHAIGKLLYLGVRNKYCSACAQDICRDKHGCFLNWSASPSELETDILLEGFVEAELAHLILGVFIEVDEDDGIDCCCFSRAVLQKSVLQCWCIPKQCRGPFCRSCLSAANAVLTSLSWLLILIAALADDTSLFRIFRVSLPLPL